MANADVPRAEGRADRPAANASEAPGGRDTSPSSIWGDPAASAVDRQPGLARVNGVATLGGVRRDLADDARPPQRSSGMQPGFGKVDGVPVLGARTQESGRVEPVTRETPARERAGLFADLPTGVPAVLGVRAPESDPDTRDGPAAGDREFDPPAGLLDNLNLPPISPPVIGVRPHENPYSPKQAPQLETVDGVPTLTGRPLRHGRYAPDVTRGAGEGATDQEGGQ